MCQNHSNSVCTKKPLNSTDYALEQALLADDTVSWHVQRLLIVEAIDAGAHIDHPVEHIHGNMVTALYIAVIHADTELIKYLIQKSANANLELYDNSTIFSYVDSLSVAQCLVACGVKPFERAGTIFGGLLHGLMQPVPQAVELMQFYLEQGANPNLPDWSGDTPFHALARKCSEYKEYEELFQKKVVLLVQAGADATIKNSEGKTAQEVLRVKSGNILHF